MSISLNTQSAVQTNTDTAVAIKTAQKANSQQEIEGQMALNLIESAGGAGTQSVPSPQGNAGHNINIKV